MSKRKFVAGALAAVMAVGFGLAAVQNAEAGHAPKPGAGAGKWRKFVLGNPKPPVRPK